MKTKKILVAAIFALSIIVAMIIFRLGSQTLSGEHKIEVEGIAVSVARAGYGAIESSIAATGTLEGIHEAEVISETSGKVVEVHVDVDAYLPAGGRIAAVENELQKIALDQAKAQTDAARANSEKTAADLRRVQRLFLEKAVSESGKENAELAAKAALAQLRGAEAAEKLAQKHYDDTFLRTPIAGRLAQKFITIGKMLSPGVMVATVVDDSKMKLDVGIPEEYVSSVKKGDSVTVTSGAVPGIVYHGKVKSVALKADPLTRTFLVEVEFPNDARRSVKSGMFASAVITTSAGDGVLIVPSSALSEGTRGDVSVYIVEQSRAVKRKVTVGVRGDSLVAVTKGILPGDSVITFGHQNLKDGSTVRVASGD